MKLAKVASLNTTLSEEVVDLRAALEACESKWYDEGFVDAEKGVEPVVMQARQLSFQEGWIAALQALEVPKDSPLKDPGRIPFLDPTLATQNLAGPNDEEETDSLRELVEQIDAHVEMIEIEATSNPPTNDPSGENVHLPPPISEHHSIEMAFEMQPVDLTS